MNLIKNSKCEGKMKTGGKRAPRVQIDDDELLIAALFRTKFFGSCAELFNTEIQHKKPKALGTGGKCTRKEKQFALGERTVLCWLIDVGIVCLNDIIHLRSAKTMEVVKDGWVTREGITCSCCSAMLSVSEFMAHAGLKQQSSPLVLFLQSTKPYSLCQLEAWSTEYTMRKCHMREMGSEDVDPNDDLCALCGDEGNLVCCDKCPSAYHQSCLLLQELPEGSWYCPNCVCMTCGDAAGEKETLSFLAVLECSQCGRKYHETCTKRRVHYKIEDGSRVWFCEENCQEVYLGFHSRVGVVNHIDDGFSWTVLRRCHVEQKGSSKEKLALVAK